MRFFHANLPNGRLTSVRTIDPHWEKGLNSSADFNPNHNHVNVAQKQASLQTVHVYTTMQPPSKITVCKCTRLNNNL
jgi:hypothetical protein